MHFTHFVKPLSDGLLQQAQLGLGHSYSRSKVCMMRIFPWARLIYLLSGQIQSWAGRQHDNTSHRFVGPDGQGYQHLCHAREGVVLLALS